MTKKTKTKMQRAYEIIKDAYEKVSWIDEDDECFERQLSASDLIRLAIKNIQCRGLYPNEKDLLRELGLY